MKSGDFVKFVGSFFVDKGDDLRHIMTSLPREGVVVEIQDEFIKIFSENEFCILISTQKKLFKIKVINSSL